MSTEQVEPFLRYLADDRRLSVNTLSAYRNDLRQFESHLAARRGIDATGGEPIPETALLATALRDEVVEFFLHLREKGYSPATIARKMAAVKSIYQFLHRRGDIPTNPAAALGSPEVKKPLPRAISVADIDRLIVQAAKRLSPEGLRDAAMLQLLCATGMRVTELVTLDLSDIDFEHACVYCTGRHARRRTLPLDERAVATLGTYLREGRPRLLRGEHQTEALFLNHRGRRLTRQGFWLIMKALARDSGIAAEVTPHTLRHSFAAHRLKDGLELNRLRELLGHANISTTQIYTQVRFDQPARASVQKPVGAGS
jgi:integrase/recombinase XerD